MPISDYTDLLTAYDENADYDTQADGPSAGAVTKCRAFIAACRGLLPRLGEMRKGEGSVKLDANVIKAQLDAALAWLSMANASASSGGSVTFASFENGRQ